MESDTDYQRMMQLNKFRLQYVYERELPTKKNIDSYVKKVQYLESASPESNRSFLLLNHVTFTPVYVCKDFEKETGFSLEYIKAQGLPLLFKVLHFSQISLIFQIHKWAQRVKEMNRENLDPKTATITMFGLKFKDKFGRSRAFMVTQKLLTFAANGELNLSLLTFEEINYIHNSDVFWYRVSVQTKLGKRTKVFFENSTKKEADDIFTSRELEILKLSIQKHSIQEISDHLEISKNTVERHRKNMISKIGVTNMTAILYVAKKLALS
jgi:DNA-binding CsgD family transcriptional regulator